MRIKRWLSSVIAAGKRLAPELQATDTDPSAHLLGLCRTLLSSKGEALGTAVAKQVLDAYLRLDDTQKQRFFEGLAEQFRVDETHLNACIAAYQASPDDLTIAALHQASESPRQTLFRRMNMAPNGTYALVKLRESLLPLLKAHPPLQALDHDLQHLLRSWFNPGFLQLQTISWETSALVLEKLIAYEAVHTMRGWEDLQRRLASDRRCFAFFHPAIPDEPIIFVEVALTQGLAKSVDTLLTSPVNSDAETVADTAIFYSISDCQPGLKGISLGNFLIKQVVYALQSELPRLRQFATLSPIPGFRQWLLDQEEHADLADYFDPQQRAQYTTEIDIQQRLLAHCQTYLQHAKRGMLPLDPVARFHLRNGAALGACHWQADSSTRGISQSAGIMINYVYDIELVEQRHEQFVNQGAIALA
jgi:malonyl-CoA decarboxylase